MPQLPLICMRLSQRICAVLAGEAFHLIRERKNPTESIPEPQRTTVNTLIDVLERRSLP